MELTLQWAQYSRVVPQMVRDEVAP
jgi:hypothetical protein